MTLMELMELGVGVVLPSFALGRSVFFWKFELFWFVLVGFFWELERRDGELRRVYVYIYIRCFLKSFLFGSFSVFVCT